METDCHDVLRDYIIYREKHKKLRKDSPRSIKIIRRDGKSFVRLNPMKIVSAVERAFRDTLEISGPTPLETINAVNMITDKVVDFVVTSSSKGGLVGIEMIQDKIEEALMEEGFFTVAKDFILYRSLKSDDREKDEETELAEVEDEEQEEYYYTVVAEDGTSYKLSRKLLHKKMAFACRGHEELVSADELVDASISNFYEGIKEDEVDSANIMAARVKIEQEPAYTHVASNLLLDMIYRETMGISASHTKLRSQHKKYFKEYFRLGVSLDRLDPQLLGYDLDKLANAIDLKRDLTFTYLGLQNLYDRYFIHEEGRGSHLGSCHWCL